MESEKIATMLTEHENKIHNNERRIQDLEEKTDRIESLTLSVQKLALSVESMAKEQIEYRTRQNELAKRILDVERAPEQSKAKKHDDLISWIAHAVISGIIGFILCYIGLSK